MTCIDHFGMHAAIECPNLAIARPEQFRAAASCKHWVELVSAGGLSVVCLFFQRFPVSLAPEIPVLLLKRFLNQPAGSLGFTLTGDPRKCICRRPPVRAAPLLTTTTTAGWTSIS